MQRILSCTECDWKAVLEAYPTPIESRWGALYLTCFEVYSIQMIFLGFLETEIHVGNPIPMLYTDPYTCVFLLQYYGKSLMWVCIGIKNMYFGYRTLLCLGNTLVCSMYSVYRLAYNNVVWFLTLHTYHKNTNIMYKWNYHHYIL
jgi:hypothetical protein